MAGDKDQKTEFHPPPFHPSPADGSDDTEGMGKVEDGKSEFHPSPTGFDPSPTGFHPSPADGSEDEDKK